jgi:DNA-binding transcriptional ArsR family regulator
MDRRGGTPKRIGTIDLDTGEIFEEGIPVWVNAKVRWREDWFMGFQQAFIKVSEDRDMNLDMTRVWLNLLGRISFENWITVPQKEMALALGMKPSNLSRAIRKLVEKGLIIKGPKMGRTSAYKLNSKYAWKGKVTNLSKDRCEVLTLPKRY